MKRTKGVLMTMILLTVTFFGFAQKGTGNDSGIARSNTTYGIEQISGELQEIINEPCTETTGKYSEGTHLLVKTGDGNKQTLNVHLGPASVVSDMTDQLKTGKEIQIKVFSTNDLPDNQYIAQEFSVNGETYELRDENLRPFWAGNGKGPKGKGRR